MLCLSCHFLNKCFLLRNKNCILGLGRNCRLLLTRGNYSGAYLLCACVNAVHKQTHAAVLQHASLVEYEAHVAPLSLLGQFRTPEPHRCVVQDRCLVEVSATCW